MFMKAKKAAATPAPQKNPAVVEAEKAIARGQRIKGLSEEADMWLNFAEGCKPGRHLIEQYPEYGAFFAICPEQAAPYLVTRLNLKMDEDSALLWAAFAVQMARQCERRLKDILGA